MLSKLANDARELAEPMKLLEFWSRRANTNISIVYYIKKIFFIPWTGSQLIKLYDYLYIYKNILTDRFFNSSILQSDYKGHFQHKNILQTVV